MFKHGVSFVSTCLSTNEGNIQCEFIFAMFYPKGGLNLMEDSYVCYSGRRKMKYTLWVL